MAIFHSTTKIIGRKSGRSSVAAAAYRSGEKLHNEHDGLTHDYTLKGGILHSEIMLPENAPEEYENRQTLWNAVELAEKRRDAQTAREIELALPNELSYPEQLNLLRDYTQENFVDNGMIADFSIHSGHKHKSKGDDIEAAHDKNITPDNPHAHIMLTTRRVTPDGFEPTKARDWNDSKNVTAWRKDWADRCNREFERKGLPERIDHRSYEQQGKDREPSIHMGAAASGLERKGKRTEKGDINREIKERNEERKRERERAKTPREVSKSTGKEVMPLSEYAKKHREENPVERERCQEVSRER